MTYRCVMNNDAPATATGTRPRADRGDETRERLLLAAIDVFGRYGFDGASTRMLASAAATNLQAIPYHFGGKEGLYLAAAEHIAARITAHVTPVADQVRARLAEGPVADAEARALLARLLESMAHLLLSEESAPWARFIIREQMEPSEAFERVYRSVMAPMLETAGLLVAHLLGAEPGSERTRLRTVALVGSILVFRMARAAALRRLDWQTVETREFAAIRDLIHGLVAEIGQAGGHR